MEFNGDAMFVEVVGAAAAAVVVDDELADGNGLKLEDRLRSFSIACTANFRRPVLNMLGISLVSFKKINISIDDFERFCW